MRAITGRRDAKERPNIWYHWLEVLKGAAASLLGLVGLAESLPGLSVFVVCQAATSWGTRAVAALLLCQFNGNSAAMMDAMSLRVESNVSRTP